MVNLQVDVMNWKKKSLLYTQIWAENMILMIPDMFKFWYVSCISYSEWGLSAPLDKFHFLLKLA